MGYFDMDMYVVYDTVEKRPLTSLMGNTIDECRNFIDLLNGHMKKKVCIMHFGWYKVE